MDYSKMTNNELNALCKEKKIKGYSGKNKAVLVDMLSKSDKPPVSAPTIKAETDVKIEPVVKVEMDTYSCISCPDDIMDGYLITSENRRELFGNVAGGAGSRKPEEYQRKKIEDGTGIACPKTNTRINLRTNTLKDISQPNKNSDGFDYSEDFDGCQSVKENKVFINLKSIVGKGGAQTRSLREVYWFVEGQLKTLKSVENVYFANILDGDEAHSTMSKFEYLLNLLEFDTVKNRVYVGDLKGYFEWFKKVFKKMFSDE